MSSVNTCDMAWFEKLITGFEKHTQNLPSLIASLEDDLPPPFEEMDYNITEKIRLLQEHYQEEESLLEQLTISAYGSKDDDDPQIELDKNWEKLTELAKEGEEISETIIQKKKYFEELEKEEKMLRDENPKLRKKYDVCAGTFAIKWDETAPENEVKGLILRRATHDVVPFSISTETNSSFFVTNYLWKLLGDPDAFLN